MKSTLFSSMCVLSAFLFRSSFVLLSTKIYYLTLCKRLPNEYAFGSCLLGMEGELEWMRHQPRVV